MSQITDDKAANLKVEARLLKLLDWEPSKLYELRYELGEHYLRQVLPLPSDVDNNRIRHSLLYWKWWQNAWYRRDAAFSHRVRAEEGECRMYPPAGTDIVPGSYGLVESRGALRAIYLAIHQRAHLGLMPAAGLLTTWLAEARKAAKEAEKESALAAYARHATDHEKATTTPAKRAA